MLRFVLCPFLLRGFALGNDSDVEPGSTFPSIHMNENYENNGIFWHTY